MFIVRVFGLRIRVGVIRVRVRIRARVSVLKCVLIVFSCKKNIVVRFVSVLEHKTDPKILGHCHCKDCILG